MPNSLSTMTFSTGGSSKNFVYANKSSNIIKTNLINKTFASGRHFSLFNNMLLTGGSCGSCGKNRK
tara:strand:- start:1195 stop:1392 length:198 start_codon:yes stop_codon:yes gene_type:complete